MKSPLLFTLALAALPLLPAGARAQINVSGSAEVKVAPDEIRLNVGVETRDEKLDVARRQNDERIAAALAFLKDNRVPDKDMQTDFINVEPEYDYNRSHVQPVTYIVRKSIEIRLTGVTNLESTLTGLLTNGVNYVHGIEFRTTHLRQYRDQARDLAIKAAREKAEAMAGALDVKRGKVTNITVSDWGGGWGGYWSNWGPRWGYNSQAQNVVQNLASSGGNADIAGETFSVGQIAVSASVNVSFAIE